MASCFRVWMPDGSGVNLLYTKETDTIAKSKIVDRVVFSHIIACDGFHKEFMAIEKSPMTQKEKSQAIQSLREKYKNNNIHEYCLSHWIWLNRFDPNKYNYEDKVKMLLDRLGTFYLMGEIRNGFVVDVDERKKDRIVKNEYPVSTECTDVWDTFYSTGHVEDFTPNGRGSTMIYANEVLVGNIEIEEKENKIKERQKKKYKNTCQYKINRLYHTECCVKRVLYKLKNKDLSLAPRNQVLQETELKKWQDKPFRNIHGENVYTVEWKPFKGNKGYLHRDRVTAWRWCPVDTNNQFTFCGKQYRIDETVPQYRGKEIKLNRKGDTEIHYDMDSILCYEQLDADGHKQVLCFDMNIQHIDSKYIIKE